MKFYVHHHLEDQTCTPEKVFTIVFYTAENLSVRKVIEIFTRELHRRLPEHQSVNSLSEYRLTRKKKPLLTDDDLQESDLFPGEDFVLIKTPIDKPDRHEVKSQQKTSTPVEKKNPSVKEILKNGKKLEASGKRHQAAALYREWLKEKETGIDSSSVWKQLAYLHLRAARSSDALKCVRKALCIAPDCLSLKLCYSECLLAMQSSQEALEVLLNYSKKVRAAEGTSTHHKHQLCILMSRAYKQLDQRDMAIVLLQGVIRENPEHHEAAMEFARLTYDLDEERSVQSLTLLLTCLVKDPENKVIQKYLTELCNLSDGLKHLEEACKDSWLSVPAVLLLARIFRDNGALDISKTMMERAISLDGTHPEAILMYIHLLEIVALPEAAVNVVKSFCESPDCSSVVFKEMCHVVGEILTDSLNRWNKRTSPAADSNSTQKPSHNDHPDLTLAPQPNSHTDDQPTTSSKQYPLKDLSVLAIWFTAVKILYLNAMFEHTAALCNVLVKYHTNQYLHTTCIRNEAAFFGCISKIVKGWMELPQPTLLDLKHIYVVGDSHCIPSSWQTIHYKGDTCVLVPCLSTGTKIWHLRTESSFYPKTTFMKALESLPDKATVIFVLGEIDCREGLLTSVEKLYYDSVEEAVDAVVSLYLDIVCEVSRGRSWSVYVHPVPPVLSITRPMVSLFNQVLHRTMEKKSQSTINMKYLAIADKLMAPDAKLDKKLVLDGTHLHPTYVSLIEDAMEM